ncbi:TetR/AcrR family transcriptional regulator [Brachybacterium sp. DNPG3]
MTETSASEDAPAREERGLREQKKASARLAMHRAAIELVAEEGLSGVTVQMIARRAGVSTRTFFNYWSTKEAAILGAVGDEAPRAVASLQEHLAVLPPREALRATLREAISSVPVDTGLRELKKQIMAREPSLQLMSTGNLQAMQTELIEALAAALEGEHAHDRAIIMVQVAFGLTRSAFAISMRRGTDVVTAFDWVLQQLPDTVSAAPVDAGTADAGTAAVGTAADAGDVPSV